MFQISDKTGVVDMALGVQVAVSDHNGLEKAEIGHVCIIHEIIVPLSDPLPLLPLDY
jgi:hypothetical protein